MSPLFINSSDKVLINVAANKLIFCSELSFRLVLNPIAENATTSAATTEFSNDKDSSTGGLTNIEEDSTDGNSAENEEARDHEKGHY
jgi:hypothetical protein